MIFLLPTHPTGLHLQALLLQLEHLILNPDFPLLISRLVAAVTATSLLKGVAGPGGV
jgi:hypothetical protein